MSEQRQSKPPAWAIKAARDVCTWLNREGSDFWSTAAIERLAPIIADACQSGKLAEALKAMLAATLEEEWDTACIEGRAALKAWRESQ